MNSPALSRSNILTPAFSGVLSKPSYRFGFFQISIKLAMLTRFSETMRHKKQIVFCSQMWSFTWFMQ